MSGSPEPLPRYRDLWWAYRLRWKRRNYLFRSIRARHALQPVADRTKAIRENAVLCFATMRNEAARLPGFLEHYRRLGVDHFLLVVHDSQDQTLALAQDQRDVSIWTTGASYRNSRFGLDWLGWLLTRYGHGHWCVTVDADELLIYPHWQNRDLHQLGAYLDATGRPAMGALMLDLYPKGPLDQSQGQCNHDPLAGLEWFDSGPYSTQVQYPKWNRWTRGGPRARMFFADRPERAPTLNKLPLVRWHRRFAYANSTHSILPRYLNAGYDGPGDPRLSGVLLHTKFMPDIVLRSGEEKQRGEHFGRAQDFAAYYDALGRAPDLWHSGSVLFEDWQQLVALGLMSAGAWADLDPIVGKKT